MILTPSDLHDLTGYVRPSAQVRWLRRHGWRFTVNALGVPVVALAEFNRHLVGRVVRESTKAVGKAISAAKKKIRILGDKALNSNLSYFCDSLAEAYRCGAEEAQSEIVGRLIELEAKLQRAEHGKEVES